MLGFASPRLSADGTSWRYSNDMKRATNTLFDELNLSSTRRGPFLTIPDRCSTQYKQLAGAEGARVSAGSAMMHWEEY